MTTNVIELHRSQLNKIIGNWKAKYGEGVSALATGLMLALEASDVGQDIVNSGHPYAEICFVHGWSGDRYFHVKIHCWAFVVDTWDFENPSDANLRNILEDKLSAIPWEAMRAEPRGVGIKKDFTWHGKLDLYCDYWKEIERMLLADLPTRSEPHKTELEKFWRLGAPYSKRGLSQLLKAKITPESSENRKETKITRDEIEARRCHAEISAGEFNGIRGFYSRYFRSGNDLCIFFSPESVRGRADSGIDSRLDGRRLRIPWKEIENGRPFVFECILADYALDRLESAYFRNVLYLNAELFDRRYFTPVVASKPREPKPFRMSFDRLDQEFDDIQILFRKAEGKLRWRLSAGELE